MDHVAGIAKLEKPRALPAVEMYIVIAGFLRKFVSWGEGADGKEVE